MENVENDNPPKSAHEPARQGASDEARPSRHDARLVAYHSRVIVGTEPGATSQLQ